MSAAVCRGSLRIGSRTLASLPIAAPGQTRWLSSTHSRAKAIVHFRPGGSPELKKMLRDINEYVILPRYLTPVQRKKIHKLKYKKDLQRDPITIEIDGKKHEFRYRELRDKPNMDKGLPLVIGRMRRQDFARNLFPLLEGCYSVANLKPADPRVFTNIIHRGGSLGAMGAVLECIYKAKQTKFYLRSHEMINELFFQLQRGAWESGWEREPTQKGLRRINRVLDVLEAEKDLHHKLPESPSTAFPFFRDPQFLAARLHLMAATALRPRDLKARKGAEEPDQTLDEGVLTAEEEIELVAKYAREIVQLWPKDLGLLDCRPDEAYSYKSKNGMKYLLLRPTFVWTAAPIVSAFRMAQQVLSKDDKKRHSQLIGALKDRADKVEEELQAALPQSLKDERAMSVYKTLFPDTQVLARPRGRAATPRAKLRLPSRRLMVKETSLAG